MEENKRTPNYSEVQTDRLLTVADLSAYLNASRTTIYRLIREGALRPVHFDDRPRFRLRDVEELLDRALRSDSSAGAGS
jgi:excisionase family DNA binding protein